MAGERTVVREVVNARLYSDGSILIKGIRASYPHVFVPKSGTDDDGNPTKPSFSIVGLMSKKTHGAAKDLILAEIDKMLKANNIERLAKDRKFLRNGDDAAKDGYDGMYTVSARESEEHPPAVRGPDKSLWTPTPEKKKLIYGGCFGNVLIRPWFQNHTKYGKRVNANFLAFQWTGHGDPFGEGVISQSQIDDTFDHEGDGPDGTSGHETGAEFDTDGL
jgi:hypothetical protein